MMIRQRHLRFYEVKISRFISGEKSTLQILSRNFKSMESMSKVEVLLVQFFFL